MQLESNMFHGAGEFKINNQFKLSTHNFVILQRNNLRATTLQLQCVFYLVVRHFRDFHVRAMSANLKAPNNDSIFEFLFLTSIPFSRYLIEVSLLVPRSLSYSSFTRVHVIHASLSKFYKAPSRCRPPIGIKKRSLSYRGK